LNLAGRVARKFFVKNATTCASRWGPPPIKKKFDIFLVQILPSVFFPRVDSECLRKSTRQIAVCHVKLGRVTYAEGVSHPFLRTKIGCIKDSCAP
jgi:hypothetical protein